MARWGGGLLALCLAWLLPLAPVQAQEEVDAPITAEATPQVLLAGQPVVLKGETPKLPPGSQVTVTVRVDTTPGQDGGDDAEPVEHKVDLDEQGHWTLQLRDDATATAGRYAVVVTGPDGKGEASTQFDVVDDDALDELIQSVADELNKSLEATADAAIATLTENALALPAGPERDGIVVRVNKVVQAMVEIKRTKLPPLPPLPPSEDGTADPVRVQYTEVIGQFRQVIEQSDSMRAQLAKTRRMADVCQRLDTLVEALNMTSSIVNFMGGPLTIAKNLVGDKVIPALVDRRMGGDTAEAKDKSFSTSSALKVVFARLDQLSAVVAGVPGLALDAVNHITKTKIYDKYCTRFEGMFTATFTAKFYTDESGNADPYYQYRITLGGVASLTQPKEQGPQSEATVALLRGRLDGQAVEYQVLQDALKLNPKLRSMLLFEQFIVPPEKVKLMPPEFGVGFNAAAHPLGFQIPITAERQRDILTVNFGPAALQDMNPKFNRGLLIQMFLAGGIPAPNYQIFPIQDAYFILSRGMRKDARFERMDGKQRFANSFHREENPPGIKLVWDVNVEMCNPGCATASSTIDRMNAWYGQYAGKRDAGKPK